MSCPGFHEVREEFLSSTFKMAEEFKAAKSRIEALEAELAAVKDAYERMNDAFIADGDIIAEQRLRAETAEARLSEMEKEVERLREALKFSDVQATKLEAILEPHVQWDETDSLPVEGGA